MFGAASCEVASATGSSGASELSVAAAASLRHVMPALVAAYEARPDAARVSVSYGSSGGLRQQVEGGAPIDVVVFASAAPVDALIVKGLAQAESRHVVALNELLLIGPRGAPGTTWATLGTLPAGSMMAVGDPGAVPAGHYAREVMQRLGSWDELEGRMVFGMDVAATLAYARRGEVAAAAVYRTDLRGIDDVEVLDVAQGDWAPRVEVVTARIAREHGATRAGSPPAEDADAFLAFLASEEARSLWTEYGFSTP